MLADTNQHYGVLGTWTKTRLRDWDWIFAVSGALFIIGLTFIPYLLGYALAHPGTEFTGMLMNSEDANSYLAKMQQGYSGSWLYEIPYTSEAQAPEFVGGFYLLLGHLARSIGLTITQMWHVSRALFGLLMFLVVFGFCKSYITDSRTRWLAFIFAITGSGLGWLLFVFGQTYLLGDFPVDFKMPEAHLFFAAMTFPHFAAGTALLVSSVWLSGIGIASGQRRYFIAAGCANLALAIVYPFLIYLTAVVLFLNWAWLCLDSRKLRLRTALHSGLALVLPAPLLLYYAHVLQTNPVFRVWDMQAVTPSPNPIHYLISYGALLLLAAPTWRRPQFRGLWAWVLAAAILVYAPLNPQRRFVEGIQVPLAILAASGLTTFYLPRLASTELFRRLASRKRYSENGVRRLLVVALSSCLALSNFYVLVSMSASAAVVQSNPFFRSFGEIRAADWAASSLPARSVVLAAYETSNFLPTRGSLKTVIGHWAETEDFQAKYDSVADFFAGSTSDARRLQFLKEQHVDYLEYGPRERTLGAFDPFRSTLFGVVYRQPDWTILQVLK